MAQGEDFDVIRWEDGSTTFETDGDEMLKIEPAERGVRIVRSRPDGNTQEHADITIHEDNFDRVLEALLRARRYHRLDREATD